MKNSCLLSSLLVLAMFPALNAYSQVQQSWAQRYSTLGNDVPVAIKTSGSSVYVLAVTNRATPAADIILIKYNSSGTIQWSQTYNGPGNDSDRPAAMTLDAAGNIYVVGQSTIRDGNGSTGQTVTLKYNSSGSLLWTALKLRPDQYPCEPNAVAVDVSGNVYVTGSTIQGDAFAYDFMTIKYNSSGVEQWMRTYNGTANGVDMDTKIALDASGNIYVTGQSRGRLKKGKIITETFADFYTIKYDPNGNIIWARRYNSPFNSGDIPRAVALDASGNLYITGESSNASNSDFLTVKFDVNGNLVYAVRFNGVANFYDGAKAIVVNGAGEAYVAGFSDPFGGSYNYMTIKYGAAGAQLWTASYNGPINDLDVANAISMDGSGNIYVTGESETTVSTYRYDFATVKYNSAGVQQWAATYNVTGLSNKASAIAVYTPPGPAAQNPIVYVTGESEGSGTGLDIATVRYIQPLVIGSVAATAGNSSLSNYPNPFNASTTIEFELPYDSDVSITVMDVMTGREVETISVGEVKAGKHSQVYNPNGLRKGNYIYKVIAESPNGKFTESKIMRLEN